MKAIEILKHLVILAIILTFVLSNSQGVIIEPNSQVIGNNENVIKEILLRSYDLTKVGAVTTNSEVHEDSVLFITLIVIFNSISLVGIILIIKFFLNRRKITEETNKELLS